MARRVSVGVLGLLFGLAGSAPALVITSPCGVDVPRGETATLVGDVVCSNDAPVIGNYASIRLRRGARLELNGYTLRLLGAAQVGLIYCDGRCTVVGPGRLTADIVGGGIVTENRAKIIVQDVTFDTLLGGIWAPWARLDLTNVDMAVKNLGIVARRIRVNDVDITLTNPSPAECISTTPRASVEGTDLRLTGCGGNAALWVEGKVVLDNLTSVGGYYGILATGRLALTDSSVSGATGPEGLDIVSRREPLLTNTTCSRSARLDDTFPVGPLTSWGVCSDD